MSKSVSIRPLHDRVIIERIEERTTAGGIVIPETAGDKPQRGRVRAVGAGKAVDGKLQSLEVKVGDQVLFGKYSGTEVKIDSDELVVMKEDDIMAVID